MYLILNLKRLISATRLQMLEYIVRAPFKLGDRIVNKGEALRLSAFHASKIAQRGYLLEKSIIGLNEVVAAYEARARVLVDKFQNTPEQASKKAICSVISFLIRYESLKTFRPPSPEFLQEIQEFNRTATGKCPIKKIKSKTGAGEWAGYNCNIQTGCPHGCQYCYAEKTATRYKQIRGQEAWVIENCRNVSTARCRKRDQSIMFPTTHDITPNNIRAIMCHLYNILNAGNVVVLVSKPHRKCIEAICSEFSSFRDSMIFRFSIGSLNNKTLTLWEPGAPSVSERMRCLQYAFEQGYKTSISAEPMLTDRNGAECLYYAVEPCVTEDIWFGKMRNVGGFRNSENTDLASSATELVAAYKDDEIMAMVEHMGTLPKISWKDSVQKVIKKSKG